LTGPQTPPILASEEAFVAQPRLDRKTLDDLVRRALAEDVGRGDVTTAALVRPEQRGVGRLVAREPGVLAGLPVARRLLQAVDGRLRLDAALEDGSRLEAGTVIGTVAGPLGPMLTGERTLLNFVQRLSGVATLARRYVDALAGTNAALLDTRKTLPGWRNLAKYAVAVGGGTNHRHGLYDQVLIKDNHLAASGLSPAEAVRRAREQAPAGVRVEVEVETVDHARAAAEAGAEIVMLDNMRPQQMRAAVAAVRAVSSKTLVEASGRITLRNLRAVARTGVDWISVGAVTHSAPALDIALEVEPD
jgi:nicotinate-nucleotide pyrophosphorylase (carboxylating)